MALIPLDATEEMEASILGIRERLLELAARFQAEAAVLPPLDLAAVVAAFEDVSKVVEFFQAVGAHAVEQADLAATVGNSAPSQSTAADFGTAAWADPAAAIGMQDPLGSSELAVRNRKRRKTEFANNAEYLRSRLGIGIVEARRRIRVGKAIARPVRLDGEVGAPALPSLAQAMAAGEVSGHAAALVTDSLARVACVADNETLEAMEASLVQQAAETDADTLGMVAKTWETAVDQNGAEPSEEELKARQGVFYRGRRRGLHQFVINTTDEQYEAMATAMNTATNPRIRPDAIQVAADGGSESVGTGGVGGGVEPVGTAGVGGGVEGVGTAGVGGGSEAVGTGGVGGRIEAEADTLGRQTRADEDARWADQADAAFVSDNPALAPSVLAGLDGCTRAQKLLAGLVSTCKIALNTGRLPDSGGHRAQVVVTTGYEQLAGLLTGGANAVFNGPISATAARRMACDAEIIPAVLGSRGEVLDLGRSQRFFNRATRRALVARDKGCAFPGCTMPAFWTEAHHIVPWWAGGHTSVSNGVCLCILHHDLIEQGNWTIKVAEGIPWFTPPAYIDPDRRPLRNAYWQTSLPPRPKSRSQQLLPSRR
ncbi:HNH endonuclease signature motif containing protein [Arthrobacter sp. Marseille-P9274]|uniref:HNH endonuclease signature motif containing protein n=1 Tax=Arthrobacter sp. Marseille-P9274 TaxID=2866572 RepID=UPI0021C86F9B|nr:HNH endonuclease signature motif containing protein [Arthrobacter sp. Marseille-P9274]